MNVKRISKRTISILLSFLLILSTFAISSAATASADVNWSRGTSSYLYFDASKLFDESDNNGNWFTSTRYRLFVVTSTTIHAFKPAGIAGASTSSINNNKDKSKLLNFATTSAFSSTIVSEGIDFISFVYITSEANSGALSNTGAQISRSLVYNNDDSVKSEPSYILDYTGNYYDGISSEKGAKMLYTTGGSQHPTLQMETVGTSFEDLKPTQTIGANSGGTVSYNGYAINSHTSSTNVYGTVYENSSEDINATYSSTMFLEAVPNENCSFVGWYDNAEFTGEPLSDSPSYSYTIDGTKTIYARFSGGVDATYTQNAVAVEGGTVSATLDGVSESLPFVSANKKTVELTATPNTNYVFVGWYDNSELSGEAISTDSVYSYQVKGEKTLYAKFIPSSQQTVTVLTDNAENSAGGSVTAKSGEDSISLPYTSVDGEEITLEAVANSGYEFDGWYNGNDLLSNSEEYTYTVSGANAITAKFISEVTYTKPSGTFQVNGGTIFLFDASKTNWTASRVRIVLFDSTNNKAYTTILSKVTNSDLTGKTAKSIISKITKTYNITWANISSISFIYFDSASASNSFADKVYEDLLDSSGNITQEAVSKYNISGYTAKYDSSISDYSSNIYFRLFSPDTSNNNSTLSLIVKGSNSPTLTSQSNYPSYNQYSQPLTAKNDLNSSPTESKSGGTITVEYSYKRSTEASIASFFENNTSITTTNAGKNTVSAGYGAKVVLKAEVSDEEQYSFIGWFEGDTKLEPTNKSNPLEYTYYATSERTIKALFAPIYQYEEISSTSPKTAKIVKFNYNDKLSSITIPEEISSHKIIEIASDSFKDNPGLKNVEIPSTVTTIGDKAFEGCTGLNEVTFENENVELVGDIFLNTRTADDPIYLYAETYNSTVREYADNYYYLYFLPSTAVSPEDQFKFIYQIYDLGNGEIELVEYRGDPLVEEITIPETIDGKRVVGIASKLFYKCKHTYYLFIPRYVRSIGVDALPRYATYYEVDDNNSTFKSEVDPEYKYDKSVPDARSDIYSKDGTKFIRYAAGDGTRHSANKEARKKYTVQDNVTEIADGAFKNSSTHINTITLPDSVTTIGKDAFNYCLNLKNINIPSGVTSIGDNAFMNCRRLPSITTYGSIGDKAFWGCLSLSEITINNASSLGSQVFSRCNSLNFVTANGSLTNIGNDIFEHCENLSVIKGAGLVDKIKNNNLIPTDLIDNGQRFFTQDGKTFIVTDGYMKTENDGNAFGFSDSQKYSNIVTLGIQKRDDGAIRFVTAINAELLKDDSIVEYGYIAGKVSSDTEDDSLTHAVRDNMYKVTYGTNGFLNEDLRATDNTLCGNYGKYSAETSYKYVTLAIEDITTTTDIIFARFYVKTSSGTYYGNYCTQETEAVDVIQYMTDEYGNQIYDENGNPITQTATDSDLQQAINKSFFGCAVQPSKYLKGG